MKVYYDSQCSLCQRYQQALTFLAPDKIIWIDLHREDIELPQGISKEMLLEKLHLQLENGEIRAGSEAIKAITAVIPGAERFSWLMESDSAKRALDFFYESSERLRRRLIKDCPSCQNKRI